MRTNKVNNIDLFTQAANEGLAYCEQVRETHKVLKQKSIGNDQPNNKLERAYISNRTKVRAEQKHRGWQKTILNRGNY